MSVYDPKATENARKFFPALPYAESALEACRDANGVLHLTKWQEFRDPRPAELAHTVETPVVVDGRNCLDAAAWRAAGWTYRGLRPPLTAARTTANDQPGG